MRRNTKRTIVIGGAVAVALISASANAADVREDGWVLRGNVSVDAELSKLGGGRGS